MALWTEEPPRGVVGFRNPPQYVHTRRRSHSSALSKGFFRPIPFAKWDCSEHPWLSVMEQQARDEWNLLQNLWFDQVSESHGNIIENPGKISDWAGPPGTFTPMHTASWEGYASLLAWMVKHGGDPNAVNHCGCSLLMHAAHEGQRECCKVLLEHGANKHHRSTCDKSNAEEKARRHGYPDLGDLIRDYLYRDHAQNVSVAFRSSSDPRMRLVGECIGRALGPPVLPTTAAHADWTEKRVKTADDVQ